MEDLDQQRGRWGTKLGFILAAVGSAIGLGNIWRYPYVVYENGGGAFLLPYFIALFTAGIPILILEWSLGNRYRGAGPRAYWNLSRRWEWVGWWQVAGSFIISTYYMVILGWVLAYTYFSLGTQWGSDTEGFFTGNFLGVTDSFWSVGGFQFKVLLPVLIMWAVVYWLLVRGINRGIELASRVLIPALVVMILIVVIRGVTLPGSGEGLNVLLTPDFSALASPGVWIAAYGQVFFSLSIAFSIMITYASYLPRHSDLSNSGFIMALSNSGFEFLAALGVFSVLGYLAVQQNVAVTEVATEGVGLAFIAFPQIINELPGLNSFFGFLFFGALLFAGITSAVSILEACIAAVREKFGLTRAVAVNAVCGIAFLVSLLYVTKGGLYYLDTVDHFINNYGLALSGLVEVILVAWIVRQVGSLQRFINEDSYIPVGRWWTVSLGILTPIALGVVIGFSIYEELTEAYSGYPVSGLVLVGGGAALGAIIVGFIFQTIKWRERREAS
ncbi:MAG: sodium-dependent transporter [Actinomycetota bacterium]|nr:sodium-dependent transporter [Actinomycetota bacterium]